MGELEPNDSRDVTLTDERAPGEPPRTGPREGETRGEKSPKDWRTDPEGRTQNQSQTNNSSWRDAEKERGEQRGVQDHDKAGGIGGPSPRPEADDGQWSQDAQAYDDDDYETPTQPMQGWYEEADVVRFGSAVREMMREPYPPRQAQQAERGGH